MWKFEENQSTRIILKFISIDVVFYADFEYHIFITNNMSTGWENRESGAEFLVLRVKTRTVDFSRE